MGESIEFVGSMDSFVQEPNLGRLQGLKPKRPLTLTIAQPPTTSSVEGEKEHIARLQLVIVQLRLPVAGIGPEALLGVIGEENIEAHPLLRVSGISGWSP